MYKSGDLNKNIEKLKSDLRLIRFAEKFDIELLKDGNPVVYLPILHYIFLSYSRDIAQLLLDNDYEIFSKSDKEFVEKILKALVSIFNYKPNITAKQFFSNGYAEAKVIFCSEVIRVIKQENQNIIKKRYNNQSLKNLKGSNSKNKNNESFRSAKSSQSNSNSYNKNLNFNNFINNNLNNKNNELDQEEDFINYQFQEDISPKESNKNNNKIKSNKQENYSNFQYNSNSENQKLNIQNQNDLFKKNLKNPKISIKKQNTKDDLDVMPTSPKFNYENDEFIKKYEDKNINENNYFPQNKTEGKTNYNNDINRKQNNRNYEEDSYDKVNDENHNKSIKSEFNSKKINQSIPNSVKNKDNRSQNRDINEKNSPYKNRDNNINIIRKFKDEIIENERQSSPDINKNSNFNSLKNKHGYPLNNKNFLNEEEPEAYDYSTTLGTNKNANNNFKINEKYNFDKNLNNDQNNNEIIIDSHEAEISNKNQKTSNIDFASLVNILNGLGETVKLMTNKIETFKNNIENRVGNLEAEMAIIKNKISIYENSKSKQPQLILTQSLNNNSNLATLPNQNQSQSHHDDYFFSFAADENINLNISNSISNNYLIQQQQHPNNYISQNFNRDNNHTNFVKNQMENKTPNENNIKNNFNNLNNINPPKYKDFASTGTNNNINTTSNLINNPNTNNYNFTNNNFNTIGEGPVKILKNIPDGRSNPNINKSRYQCQNIDVQEKVSNHYPDNFEDKNNTFINNNLNIESISRRTNSSSKNQNLFQNFETQNNSANKLFNNYENDSSTKKQSIISYANNNNNIDINNNGKSIPEIDDTDAMIKRVSDRFKETQKLLNEFK